jgi:hypothetical protein
VPKSIASKMALTLFTYALFGLLALTVMGQPVFVLSVYLHAMTFIFLGAFVASSAGEILFNKDEADILLHRPIEPSTLLWAKVRVLIVTAFWISAAFNLSGALIGLKSPDGGWRFLIAHTVSTAMEALFTTASVITVYQLCLRWCGRERLDSVMTAAQVMIAVSAVLSGQLLPLFVTRIEYVLTTARSSWWIGLLPPAWFAGVDDVLGGGGATPSWYLAATAVIVTTTVSWMAFKTLARGYVTGLQTISEAASSGPRARSTRRWIVPLMELPLLRWWLRNPVERASFMLTFAYLFRDRDVKLRLYPGLAPMMALPLIFLLGGTRSGRSQGLEFGLAFVGGYLGLIPLLAIDMLQYSQQWQAADVFRSAPLPGPAPLYHGARRAVLLFLTLPFVAACALIAIALKREWSELLLLLPGLITLPVFALVPNVSGRALLLSVPVDESKSGRRGLIMIGVSFLSIALSMLATWCWSTGGFLPLILVEAVAASAAYFVLRHSISRARWRPLD